jgi:4-aminobutyrate aminotransferase-like enzyme
MEQGDGLAGVFLEPVNVNAGVRMPQRSCLRRLRTATRRHGAALIFDEVQTAFGWVGPTFAASRFGVAPDLMTLGKGLAAGFPLGAILLRPSYDVLGRGEHEFTNGGHPVSCAAALAALGVLDDLSAKGHLARLEACMGERLADLRLARGVGEVRSIGLIAGIDIVGKTGKPDPRRARRVQELCRSRGVLLRVSDIAVGHSLLVKPPLVMTESQLGRALAIVQACIADAA